MTRQQIIAAIGTWLAGNVDELLLAFALLLLARGLVDVWRPGAYLVPGAVLLWIVLPTRRAFVVNDADTRRKS
jgi:hypothetical protein